MTADFASIGRALANEPRSRMIDRLMEGERASAGELARAAGVSPSTASSHIAALEKARLVTVSPEGRRHWVELASPEVAAALETLSTICPVTPVRSLNQARAAARTRALRTCYDHLAGAIGVALLDRLLETSALVAHAASYDVGAAGTELFRALNVDVAELRRQRRTFARTCIDWTERRPHLAGALGASIAEAFFANGWTRRHASGRGLRLTPSGATALRETFGLDRDLVDEAKRSCT